MALAVDTNILVHALNIRSDRHGQARDFLTSIADRKDVVISEHVLVELYLLVRNPAVFSKPYTADAAVSACKRFRSNPNWRVVECRGVMDQVWRHAGATEFARRRIIDLRLGLTLRSAGVTEFATCNTRHFEGLGFDRVFDPFARTG